MKLAEKLRRKNKRYYEPIKKVIERYHKVERPASIATALGIDKHKIERWINDYRKGKFDFLFWEEKRIMEYFVANGFTKEYFKKLPMSVNERKFILLCTKNKYPILKNGFPDFLVKKEGRWMAVEVKSHKSEKLSFNQRVMRAWFQKKKITYITYTGENEV